ncbi:MAG: DUF2637 domain-containing protein [Chloroflexi bacterium]|nr:MAG: DUF2637 domain-containing protein [Chloroflexota bacterium]
MANHNHTQNSTVAKLDVITNWLMALIVAIPFIISFGALRDLASQKAVAYPWLFPIMVDGGLIIFKAIVLRGSLHGRTDYYAWTMAAAATAVSVTLNVLHAPADNLARLMAALPPLMILAAFVAVTRRVQESAVVVNWQHETETAVQAREEAEKTVQAAESSLQAAEKRMQELEKAVQAAENNLKAVETSLQAEKKQKEKWQADAKALQAQIQAMQDELKAWQTINPIGKAAAMYNAGEFPTLQDAASVAGVSASTISRLAASLNGVGK